MSKKNITLTIDFEIKESFKKKLAEKGISMSFWVEQMMRRYLLNNEKGVH